MPRKRSMLTTAVDRSIGEALHAKGPDGFSYDDVSGLVLDKLGDKADEVMRELGERKLREIICTRSRVCAREVLADQPPLHSLLVDEHLAPIYPVTDEIGETRFKQFVYMMPDELSQVIGRLIKDRKGMDSHIKALRRVERRLKKIWSEHPGLSICEAQGYLDLKAA